MSNKKISLTQSAFTAIEMTKQVLRRVYGNDARIIEMNISKSKPKERAGEGEIHHNCKAYWILVLFKQGIGKAAISLHCELSMNNDDGWLPDYVEAGKTIVKHKFVARRTFRWLNMASFSINRLQYMREMDCNGKLCPTIHDLPMGTGQDNLLPG